jgi:hypothetical protein
VLGARPKIYEQISNKRIEAMNHRQWYQKALTCDEKIVINDQALLVRYLLMN